MKLNNMKLKSVVVGTLASALLAMTLIASSHAAGSSFNEKCPDIQKCADVVSGLLGQKYVYDADVNGKATGTPNLEITKENAETLFTNLLFLNGFTRVPAGVPETFQIVRQRDARDSAIPVVRMDYNSKDMPLPDNWDLYTMIYKAKNPESVESTARMIRSFMPGTSRVMSMDLSGSVSVTDSAMNIKKLFQLIHDNDQKPTAEMKKKWATAEHERMERMDRQGPPPQRREEGQQPPAPAAKPTT
jgi:hypothetical protein